MHLSPGETAGGNSNVSSGCRGSPVTNDQRWLPQGEFLKPQSPDDPSSEQFNGGGTIAGSPVRERHSSALRRKTESMFTSFTSFRESSEWTNALESARRTAALHLVRTRAVVSTIGSTLLGLNVIGGRTLAFLG